MIKIVKPNAETIVNNDTVLQRIERVGRICYKSEDKIAGDSRFKFVDTVVRLGHNSVLEFGLISVCFRFANYNEAFNRTKYLHSNPYISVCMTYDPANVTITASLRVWLDIINNHPCGDLELNAVSLFDKDPELSWIFTKRDIPVPNRNIRHAAIIPTPLFHRRPLVKFTVSRAISHQIVRHRVCSFMQESQRYCRYDKEMTFIEPLWVDSTEKSELFVDDCENAFYRYNRRIQQGLKPQEARGCLPQDVKTELYVMADIKEWKHIFSQRCAPGADPEMQRVMKPLQQEFLDRGWIR